MLYCDTPTHILQLTPQTVSDHTQRLLLPKISVTSATSYFLQTARDWNSLPVDTKQAPTLPRVKKLLSNDLTINPYYKLHQSK